MTDQAPAAARWAPQYMAHPCQHAERDEQGHVTSCGAQPTRRYIGGWFCADDRPELVAARNAKKIAALRDPGGTWHDTPDSVDP